MSQGLAEVGSPIGRLSSDGWVTTKRNLIKIVRGTGHSLFHPAPAHHVRAVVHLRLWRSGRHSRLELRRVFNGGHLCPKRLCSAQRSLARAMAQDLKDGIIDRFRTLPMNSAAVLIGRTNGDMFINAASMAVMMVTGFIVGWRVRSSFGEAVLAVGLILLFAYAFSWVMSYVGA